MKSTGVGDGEATGEADALGEAEAAIDGALAVDVAGVPHADPRSMAVTKSNVGTFMHAIFDRPTTQSMTVW